jgi:hypothetical protein
MKKSVFLLAIVAFSLILFSCEEDEPNLEPEPDYTYVRYRLVIYADQDVYSFARYAISNVYPVIENFQNKPIYWSDNFSGFEDAFSLRKDSYLGQTMTVSFFVENLDGSIHYEDERQVLIEVPEGYSGEEYIDIVFTVPDP